MDRLLASRPSEPAYLFVGTEAFFIEDALRMLAERLLKPETAMLDREVVAGPEVQPEAVLARASTPPFGSSRRLVIVRDIERMPPERLEVFLPYLEEPAPTCCLVFTATALPGHPPFIAALRRRQAVVSCDPLPEAKRAAWLKSQLRQLDPALTLSDEAAAMLAELDEDLTRLRNELSKLPSYLGGLKARVEPDDLRAVVGRGPAASGFDLPQAVKARQADPALRHLLDLLDEGTPPLVIIGRLRYALRRGWTLNALRPALRLLLEADLAIKRGGRPEWVLKALVLGLVGVWGE